MLRKTILYIAVSLDGYIADHAGGVSWLNTPEAAAAGDEGYRRFLQGSLAQPVDYERIEGRLPIGLAAIQKPGLPEGER